MAIDSGRWACSTKRCGWVGTVEKMLTAKNPFDDAKQIVGCPTCREVDTFYEVCDEAGCMQEATCGTPVAVGYRRTCGQHMPK